MRRHLTLALALSGAGAGVLAACGIFQPFGLDALADTRIHAICHFAYGCCTPVERDRFLELDFKDEGTCLEELNDTGGILFSIDQQAREAVSAGKAVYDGDKAEKCSRTTFDALNQCDAAALGASGGFGFSTIGLVTDASDPECVALALRDYTTGTVKDGDDCVSDFECADFGSCVVPADETDITNKGSCHASAKEGVACNDRPCVPGLSCINGACAKPDPQPEGADCSSNGDCASGNCADVEVGGSCFNDPSRQCTRDEDCAVGDSCVGGIPSRQCAAAAQVTIDVCNGL
jgi:hypothetical protein